MKPLVVVVIAAAALLLVWHRAAPEQLEDRRAEAASLAAYAIVRTPAPEPEPEPEPDEEQSAPHCTTLHHKAPTRTVTYVCYPCLRLGSIEWPLDKPIPPRAICKECGGSMYRAIEEAATEDEADRPAHRPAGRLLYFVCPRCSRHVMLAWPAGKPLPPRVRCRECAAWLEPQWNRQPKPRPLPCPT